MPDIFNSGYSPLHMLNVSIHVGFGTLAILLGLAQFLTVKGGRAHRWIGRTYLILFVVVLVTAIVGSLGFEFRAFLAALTLSAGYLLISGLRVLKIRESGPQWIDNATALLFTVSAIVLGAYMIRYPEQSTIAAYIALANLAAICAHDLARNINGPGWLRLSWLNEHIYKIVGTHSALISAAAGNLFASLQPWSIFLPPVISMLLVVFFVVRHPLPRNQS